MIKTAVALPYYLPFMPIQVGAIVSYRRKRQTTVGVVIGICKLTPDKETTAKYLNVKLLLDEKHSYKRSKVVDMDGNEELVANQDITVLTDMALAKVFVSADDVQALVDALGYQHPSVQSIITQVEQPLPDDTAESELKKALKFLEYMKTVKQPVKTGTKPSRYFD